MKFCSLSSGSSGNSQFIASRETRLLLDAGVTGKYIKEAMESIGEKPEDLDGILVTHEHSDHIKGVGVLMRRYGLPLYVHENTWLEMKSQLGKINMENIHFIDGIDKFEIKDLSIKPFAIDHDAAHPLGFSFENEGVAVSVATDLGHMTDETIEILENSDLLLLETNHDVEMLKVGRYPWFLKQRIMGDSGHLSNEDAGMALVKMVERGAPGCVLLGHLSHENNFPELAMETVRGILEENGLRDGRDIDLDMTYRNRVGRLYNILK
ncbi:MAG: MBL fold metallo-hydrolase [Peptostreptococcaceae bacterium]|nr:MBL fold metallo-hydrolase [Peptostreptococcaceae bacterium]